MLGKHFIISASIVFTISLTLVSKYTVQAGARPKTVTTTTTTTPTPEEQNLIAVTKFKHFSEEAFLDHIEGVFTRAEPATNIQHMLKNLPRNLPRLPESGRPSITGLEQVSRWFLETRSYKTTKDVISRRMNFCDDEKAILPILNYDNDNQVTVDIMVDTNGKAMFSTPYTSNFKVIGLQKSVSIPVEFETDKYNNTYVFLPLVRRKDGSEGRVQLWVNPSERFMKKETKEHLFHRFDYYIIPREYLPGWLFEKIELQKPVPLAEEVLNKRPSAANKLAMELNWTPNACLLYQTTQIWSEYSVCSAHGKWVIHGLFNQEFLPQYNEIKANCKWQVYRENQLLVNPDQWRDKTLVDQLKNWWPSIDADKTDVEWWSRVWCVHGKYMFNDQEEYFRTALKLYYQTQLHTPFQPEEAAFPDNQKVVKLQNFVNSIESKVGKSADFYCATPTSYFAYVHQIKVCFDGNHVAIDCEKVHIANCTQYTYKKRDLLQILGIHHFAKAEMISYLVFTLVSVQTQKNRLPRAFMYQGRGWKVHKLCPSSITGNIQYHYLRERGDIINSWEIRLMKNAQYIKNTEYLDRIWPSLEIGVYNIYNWKRKWTQCGFPLTSLKMPEFQDFGEYIDTIRKMYNRLRADQWQIYDQVHTPESFHQTLYQASSSTGGVVLNPGDAILVCTTIENQVVLAKIRICYSLKLEQFPCPPAEETVLTSKVRKKNTAAPYVACDQGFAFRNSY